MQYFESYEEKQARLQEAEMLRQQALEDFARARRAKDEDEKRVLEEDAWSRLERCKEKFQKP